METVTLSSKYQLVLPRGARERLNLRPGMRITVLDNATIAPVNEPLTLEAADLSLAHGLAMADALVYATARRFRATLVTGDADFDGLPDAVVVR
jgi:AbrB family looped-hinge helix DNA binding protein